MMAGGDAQILLHVPIGPCDEGTGAATSTEDGDPATEAEARLPHGGRPGCGRGRGLRPTLLRALAGAAACVLLGLPSLAGVRMPPTGVLRADLGDATGLQIDKNPTLAAVICSVELANIAFRITQAVTGVRSVLRNCAEVTTEDQKAVCAGRVGTIISALANVITSSSSAASACPGIANEKAACTAGISRMFSASATLTSSTVDVTQSCHLWWHSVRVPPNGRTTTLWTTTTCPRVTLPRVTLPSLATVLERKNVTLPTIVPLSLIDNTNEEDFQWSMAQCVAYTGIATNFMFRAGLVVDHSLITCAPKRPKGPEACAIDWLSFVGALGQASRYWSLSVVTCAGVPAVAGSISDEARCSAGISGIVGSTFRLMSAMVSFTSVCHPHKRSVRHWW